MQQFALAAISLFIIVISALWYRSESMPTPPLKLAQIGVDELLNQKTELLTDNEKTSLPRNTIIIFSINEKRRQGIILGLPTEKISVRNNVVFINGKQSNEFINPRVNDFEEIVVLQDEYLVVREFPISPMEPFTVPITEVTAIIVKDEN